MAWSKERKAQYMREYWVEKKDLLNANRRQRRQDNPEKVRSRARKHFHSNREKIIAQMRVRWHARKDELNAKRREEKYGLSAKQIAEMHAAQGGCCAICHEKKKLGIDHNHASGAVRALLCSPCNTALGLLKENPTRLRAALAYLQSHASGAKAAEMVEGHHPA